MMKKILKARETTSFLFLAALFLLVGIINPSFLTLSNISACFNTSVVYTLIAVGMAFAIFVGEIDVSVGSNLGLVAAVVGTMIQNGSNWFAAFAVGICIGAVVGLINGRGRGGHENPLPDLHPGHQRHPAGHDVPSGGRGAGEPAPQGI